MDSITSKAGFYIEECNAKQAARLNFKVPALFIASKEDHLVHKSNAQVLFNLYNCPNK